MSVDAILRQVAELTPAEQAEVLARLRERFEPVEMTEELAALLDARVADADAHPAVGYTWDEVVAHVKRPR